MYGWLPSRILRYYISAVLRIYRHGDNESSTQYIFLHIRAVMCKNVCCVSWRIKDQLDVTWYFVSLLFNMFRTLIYPSSGAGDYSVELPHWSYCSWFDVCWRFGVVGSEWYPCCRLKLLRCVQNIQTWRQSVKYTIYIFTHKSCDV